MAEIEEGDTAEGPPAPDTPNTADKSPPGEVADEEEATEASEASGVSPPEGAEEDNAPTASADAVADADDVAVDSNAPDTTADNAGDEDADQGCKKVRPARKNCESGQTWESLERDLVFLRRTEYWALNRIRLNEQRKTAFFTQIVELWNI